MPSLDGLLRSHIQFQGEVASYVFAGSEPGLMKQLFEHKEAPLYGSAVPLRLGRLRDDDLAGYVAERFRESKRSVGEALNPLLASAKGHPQRAMLLAHRLWEEVEPKGTATLEDWARAHTAALDELQPEFRSLGGRVLRSHLRRNSHNIGLRVCVETTRRYPSGLPKGILRDAVITDVNPFVYSRPIEPDQIVDRDEETQALLKNAVGGHYVRLYAPRKYGKTSLLQRALADGERQEGLVPVLVDLYGVVSLADVAVRFERAYAKELRGAIRGRVEEFLQKTGLGLSLGAFGISARLQLEPKTDPLPALHALLDLPLRLEESGGFRAYIALDEFQDIRKVPSLDGLLRSHIQFQGEVASYVFAGSEPGLMKQLFEHKEAPLYGSAVPLRLGRLRDDDLAGYVAERFRESKRSVGEALNPLLASAKGHPQRAMLLAHRLWEEVEPKGTATLDDWARAHAAALDELQPEFEAQWRGLDTSEQKTLRAIIAGEGSPYRTAVLERLALTKPSAQKALHRLSARAEIEADGRKQAIVDPLFAEWIAALA